MLIFVPCVIAGVLFDGAFSLWVTLMTWRYHFDGLYLCTLDSLYFCATWVKMNALNKFQKILEMVTFFVGKIVSSVIIFNSINYSSVNIIVTWQKNRHFLPKKFLPIRWFNFHAKPKSVPDQETIGSIAFWSLSLK